MAALAAEGRRHGGRPVCPAGDAADRRARRQYPPDSPGRVGDGARRLPGVAPDRRIEVAPAHRRGRDLRRRLRPAHRHPLDVPRRGRLRHPDSRPALPPRRPAGDDGAGESVGNDE